MIPHIQILSAFTLGGPGQAFPIWRPGRVCFAGGGTLAQVGESICANSVQVSQPDLPLAGAVGDEGDLAAARRPCRGEISRRMILIFPSLLAISSDGVAMVRETFFSAIGGW